MALMTYQQKAEAYDRLVRHLEECNWEYKGGVWSHRDVPQTFNSAQEAIEACIEVGSGA